jgi:lysophospholipase L1-like esterase
MNRRILGAIVLTVMMLGTAACKEQIGQPAPGSSSKAPSTGLPSSMAALGDSITSGLGSCFAIIVCSFNSWSTGNSAKVNSQYLRIKNGNPAIRDRAHNYAVAGAQVGALSSQATRAVNAKVDYVTILIGANDACRATVDQMTDPSTFRSELDQALGVLKRGLPNTRVLLVSIPDIYRVWQIGHTDNRAIRAWSVTGVCQSLLAHPTSTADLDNTRRSTVRSRIDAYNRQLAAACTSYGRRCRYDEGALHRVKFTLAQASDFDFFHPNADGQKLIASTTYPGRFTW